jgi:plastocyanin
MAVARLDRWAMLAGALVLAACGGGSTTPPGPPAQLVESGGDGQTGFFNNPLPVPYSVTVRDANGRAVPGVSVDWSMVTGGGSFSTDPSTTNSNGVASTVHTLGSATTYVVQAAVTGVPAAVVTFTANACDPPPTGTVNVRDNFFCPTSIVVQVNDSVTWTWVGAASHNVTFTGTAPPLGSISSRISGSIARKFTVAGSYNYTCTNHANMNGSVTVVN